MPTAPESESIATLLRTAPSDHPTIILLSVHKGASTFLRGHFAPALERVLGLRHVAVHQEQLRGVSMTDLALPPTGVVASRVYPPQYDTILEDPDTPDALMLNEALDRLEAHAPRKGIVVKLRYFVGFSIAETAEALDVSPATVKLDWHYARAWLHRALRASDEPPSPSGDA